MGLPSEQTLFGAHPAVFPQAPPQGLCRISCGPEDWGMGVGVGAQHTQLGIKKQMLLSHSHTPGPSRQPCEGASGHYIHLTGEMDKALPPKLTQREQADGQLGFSKPFHLHGGVVAPGGGRAGVREGGVERVR